MKRLYPLLLLVLGCWTVARTQTVLEPGDLAIIAVEFNVAQQCGSTFGTDDMFAVLTFKDIENGTKLVFTDRAFLRSDDNCRQHIFRSSEGIAEFERTGGTLPAGSIFYIMFGGVSPHGICLACSPGWTISLPTGTSPDMNTFGDQMFILQGNYQIGGKDCTPSPNLDLFEGKIIYAVSTNPTTRWLTGEAPDCSVGSATTSQVSYFPACFSPCLRINLVSDRGYLRNLPNSGTKELLLAYIAFDGNWNNGSITISPTSCLDASSNVETDFSKYKFVMADFNPATQINITGTGTNGFWRGIVDDNWFNACNWSNFILPDSTTDAVIPPTALRNCVIDIAKQPSSSTFATCRNLTVENALRPLRFVGDPTLRVFGDININGGLTCFQPGAGTVELRGSAPVSYFTASGNQINFHNLRLNRSLTAKVDLGSVDARVAGILNLRRGRFLATGSGQLTIFNPAGGALTNASGLPFTTNDPNVWVECPLQRRITQTATDYAFPVGSTTASQLFTVNFNTASDYTDVRLRYVPGPSINLPLSSVSEEGNEDYNAYLDNGWWEAVPTPAAPANLGIYTLTIQPQEVPAHLSAKDYTENTGNASTSIAKSPLATNTWSLDGKPDKTSHLKAGARVSRKDIPTGFSKFAIVIDENKPFDLKDLRLSLIPETGLGLRLDWEFDATSALAWRVQRSTTLPQFETLTEERPQPKGMHREKLASAGSYLDRTAPCDQPVWYRLEIDAADGQTTRSEIVEGRYRCASQTGPSALRVYPNPFDSQLQIEFPAEEAGSRADIELLDALGRRIAYDSPSIPTEAFAWPLNDLPAGVYTLRVSTPNQTYRVRVLAR